MTQIATLGPCDAHLAVSGVAAVRGPVAVVFSLILALAWPRAPR